MDDISKLIELITRDLKAERRIRRVTVQPQIWQKLGAVGGTSITYARLPGTDAAAKPIVHFDILGVPMELDEMQQQSFRLWDVSGDSI